MKLATNTAMYNRMEDDMDVNCGLITDGEASVAEMGEKIFNKIVETASGSQTKSEELGYGDEEFVPWHIGAVM
jgi:altronate hydrolase